MQNTTASTLTATAARRRWTTIALLAGPVVTTAGMAATPWENERTTASYHQALLASPDQAQIAALLLFFGYALLGLAALVTLLRIGDGHRRHFAVAATLSFLGATLMPGQLVTDFYDLAMAQTLPAADAVRASEATQSLPFAAPMMIPALLGFSLGPVAVGALAARTRLVGWWAPVVVATGFVVTIAVYSPAAMVAGGLVLVVLYGSIAAGLARRDRASIESVAAAPSQTVTLGEPVSQTW